MVNKPKMIAIVGPTASGKTRLAIELASKIDGEIVSADSRQIYRGMDIGTAKPSREELVAIPHHLIDIKDPNESYTIADYKNDAIAAIDEILSRGKVPLLVGGTGLYVQSVVENLDIPNVAVDPMLRVQIEKDIERDGLDEAFKKLIALDPDAEGVVDPKNPRRVVRALEVAISTGEPFTAQRKKGEPLFDALTLGLDTGVEALRERIDARVDAMFAAGLVDEVSRISKKYGADASALNAIGYREVLDHLKGTLTLDDAIAAIKMNTWHYAKRQMTWFKKMPNVHWIKNGIDALDIVHDFLK